MRRLHRADRGLPPLPRADVASASESVFETLDYREFSNEVESVPQARHFVREVLIKARCDSAQVDDTEQVVGEFAVNALQHAGSFFSVALERADRKIRVAVRDEDGHIPVVRDVGTDSESGRGLYIVSRLASQWGCESMDRGKEVWAEVGAGSV
jgi:anti-sigma regulatory factor (Ser/Thr protein kinase)